MKKLFTISFFFICIWKCNAQNWEFGTGASFPEAVNVSVRAISKGFAIGGSYGFIPAYTDKFRSINFDMAFSYGKNFKLVEQKRSQWRNGISFYREETERRIFNTTYFFTRAGRNFLFNPQIGFGVEYGFSFKIADKVTSKDGTNPSGFDFFYDNVLPSISIRFFYRLDKEKGTQN